MRISIIIIALLIFTVSCCGATPSTTVTIDPTVSTWVTDWTNLSEWQANWPTDTWYNNNNSNFTSGHIFYDATIGNYFTAAAGGSPHLRWDRTKPITARLRLIRNSANWIGFSLYAGEAEYCGFSINSGGTVSFYNNAGYYSAQNSFSVLNNNPVELQIEFDGNQTHVFKARNFDPTDTGSWTVIGTRTFKPTVDPTLQINQEGAAGTAKFGRIQVTGSRVAGYTDVLDVFDIFPDHSASCGYEWGIEFNNTGTDAGVKHYLTLAGGLTIKPTGENGSIGANNAGTWIQGTPATNYTIGTFQANTATINPAPGFKYNKLELIGALRGGGTGSGLSVAIRKADGSLVSSSDLGGAANPITFTQSAATQITIDLSAISYSGIYLDVNGSVPNATVKYWPDATGTTGPPILKQAAVTFTAGSVQSPTIVAKSSATMRASFR